MDAERALAIVAALVAAVNFERGIVELPFDKDDPRWKTIAEEKLKAASRPKRFISHTIVSDFRHKLPDERKSITLGAGRATVGRAGRGAGAWSGPSPATPSAARPSSPNNRRRGC